MSTIDLSRVTTVILLAAPNDLNGNPRRSFVAFAGSALRGLWDEGYAGCEDVPEEIRELARTAPRINVTARELLSWRRAAKALDPALCCHS